VYWAKNPFAFLTVVFQYSTVVAVEPTVLLDYFAEYNEWNTEKGSKFLTSLIARGTLTPDVKGRLFYTPKPPIDIATFPFTDYLK